MSVNLQQLRKHLVQQAMQQMHDITAAIVADVRVQARELASATQKEMEQVVVEEIELAATLKITETAEFHDEPAAPASGSVQVTPLHAVSQPEMLSVPVTASARAINS